MAITGILTSKGGGGASPGNFSGFAKRQSMLEKEREEEERKRKQREARFSKGLDKGRSWEDIAKRTGAKVETVKAFSQATRPNYGITDQPSLIEKGVDIAKGIPSAVASPFKAFGSEVKQKFDYFSGPTATERGLGTVEERMAGQKKAAALPDDLKRRTKRIGPEDSSQLAKMVNDGKSTKEIRGFLDEAIKRKQNRDKRMAGTAVEFASLGVGGVGLTQAFKAGGKKAAAKAFASTTASGAAGNTGTTLRENPEASREELQESAVVGGAFGAGGSVAASGAGAVFRGANQATRQATKQVSESRFARKTTALDNSIAQTTDPRQLAQLNAKKRNLIEKSIAKNELSLSERFNNAVFDRMYTTRKRVRNAIKATGGKQQSQDFLDKLEYATGSVSRSGMLAEDYMKKNGFADVVGTLGTKKRENEFSEYLLAKQREFRRNQAAAQGKKLSKEFAGRSKQDQATMAAFADEYEPLAQQLHEYSQGFLREMAQPKSLVSEGGVGKGIISPETAEKLIAENPEYIPLNKLLEELESTGTMGGKALGGLSAQTVVKEFKGAAGIERNPLESIYEKTQVGFNQTARNETAGLLRELADLPDNPLGIRVLGEGEKVSKGSGSIPYFDNGQKTMLEVPSYIEQGVKGLNAKQGNALIRAAFAVNRVRKLGFTGASPGFTARNLPRDIQQKAVVGRSGVIRQLNPKDFVGGFVDAIANTSTKGEALKYGAFGNLVDTLRPTRKSLTKLRKSGTRRGKIKSVITSPAELFRLAEDAVSVTETASRATAFRTRYRQVLKETGDKQAATLQATLAARRDSTDFFVQGELGDILKGWGLYLNPSIQGTRRLGQALKESPVKTTARLATVMVAPAMATTYWNLSDENRRKAWEDIPDYEKEGNFIIIGPNAKFNERTGRWDGVYKIPKAPGIREIANAAENLVKEGVDGGLDVGDFIKEIGYGVASTVSPEENIMTAITPDAIEPVAEQAANKDFFTGDEIVPEDGNFRKAKEGYSSPTAKRVAGFLSKSGKDISPLQVDAFIRDMTGSTGQGVQNIVEGAIDGKDKAGGKSFQRQIQESFSGARGGVKKEELQGMFGNVISTKSDLSKQVTEAVKDGNEAKASELALEFNKQVDILEEFAKDSNDSRRLSEKQRKILENMRFPIEGGSLSSGSIWYRKQL